MDGRRPPPPLLRTLLALATICPLASALSSTLDASCSDGQKPKWFDFRLAPSSSTLRGAETGPGEGALRYSRLAVADGHCIGLHLNVSGGLYDTPAEGHSVLGNEIGMITVKARNRLDVDGRFVDCHTGEPVQLSKFNLTFYAVNAPATRQITVRGYWVYFLEDGNLFQKQYTDLGTMFSDKSPCDEAVGSAGCGLTYFFQDTSRISMTLETIGPDEPFFFSGMFCPGISEKRLCTADICDRGYRLKSHDQVCTTTVCSVEECCERSYSICGKDTCGFGFTLKPESELPKKCEGVCTRHECCEALGETLAIDSPNMPAVASCSGHERQWFECEGLPECNPCVPKDCEFGAWSEWSPMGGCTGLCSRKRTLSLNNDCGAPCSGATEESVSRPHDPLCFPEECKPRDVDCAWGTWSDWTECSRDCPECMLGQAYRERHIRRQQVGFGETCKGSWNMTRPCKMSDAVDCKMTDWSDWSQCSESCGTGSAFRSRRVMQKAQFGGKPCGESGDVSEGVSTRETKACNQEACSQPRDCLVDTWSDWSGCPKSDMENVQHAVQRFRSREILMPGSGSQCNYTLNETEACPNTLRLAPESCTLSEWQDWSPCSATCEGQHFRVRDLIGGKATCTISGSRSLRETRSCGKSACWEEKCELSEWSEWSNCSAACGLGVATRSRKVLGDSQQSSCSAALSQVEACHTTKCHPVDCKWGDWDEWTGCTMSCGGGTKRRSRNIEAPPQHGGALCSAEAKAEVASCNTQHCDNCVDGEWGEWQDWTRCTANCGPAYRMRHRELATRSNSCGRPAVGLEDEYKLCEDIPMCEKDRDCEVSDWEEWSACSADCFGVQEKRRKVLQFATGEGKQCEETSMKETRSCNPLAGVVAPEHCGDHPQQSCKLGRWEDWSACTATCGGGQMHRSRQILSPAANDGPLCHDALEETVPCNTKSCNSSCIDCLWGAWEEWGACQKCGSQRFRHRSIEQLPNSCGEQCNPGAASETSSCHSDCEEELACAWSEWTDVGHCSAACGLGTRHRERTLRWVAADTVDDAEGVESVLFVGPKSRACTGTQVAVSECFEKSCVEGCTPQPCLFSDWMEWGECSCDQLQSRSRAITTGASCGGAMCEGALVESRHCERECKTPENCVLSEWTEWFPALCETKGQQRQRHRTVLKEPTNGGEPCAGMLNETGSCQEHMMKVVDCSLKEWSPWTTCSVSCGGGYKTRTRDIKTLASFGGKACLGDLTELADCNSQTCTKKDIDCELTDWADWTSCEGMTTRFRLRGLVREPQGNGKHCTGALKEAEACSDIVDCQVTEWSSWDQCDKSCGGGQQTRAREVAKNPRGGGQECPTQLVMTRGCNEDPCDTEDCKVSEWTAWGECDASCGLGTMKRSRNFTARPCQDGKGCDLNLEELKPCEGPPCACNDCEWGPWEPWSPCSEACDGGQRSRERHILRAPDPGCKPCEARVKEEVEGCNIQKCSSKTCINGAWDEWSLWEDCSATCMGGQTWRTRAVKQEANDCGFPATGLSMEHKSCNDDVPCAESVDCEFDEWPDWAECTSRCAGLSRRHRNIKTHGRGNGTYCEGPMEEERHCELPSGIQDWQEGSMYMDLSKLVRGTDHGFGTLMRFSEVACDTGNPGPGKACEGRTADLVVSAMSSYTGCSLDTNGPRSNNLVSLNVASGTSVTLEFRLVDSKTNDDMPARDLDIKVFDLDTGLGGSSVESIHTRGFKSYRVPKGTSIQREQELSHLMKFSATRYGTDDDDPDDPTQVSKVQDDKAIAFAFGGRAAFELTFDVSPGSFCKTFLFALRTCISGNCKADPCPADDHPPGDCELSDWEEWGSCDATCGVGQKARSRKVLKSPVGGLGCNRALSETTNCSVARCEVCTPVDCAWEDWQEWGACDRCDGQMRRHRHIAAHPACGGKACNASVASEIANCTRSCQDKVYCEWAEWQSFGACTATCGKGMKSRMRYLKALSKPPHQRELLGGFATENVDFPELKYEELVKKKEQLQVARFKGLALAFLAGCLSLALLLGVLSRGSRWVRSSSNSYHRMGLGEESPGGCASNLTRPTLE